MRFCNFPGVGTYALCDSEEEVQAYLEAKEHAHKIVNGYIDASPRTIRLAEKFNDGTLTREDRIRVDRAGFGESR